MTAMAMAASRSAMALATTTLGITTGTDGMMASTIRAAAIISMIATASATAGIIIIVAIGNRGGTTGTTVAVTGATGMAGIAGPSARVNGGATGTMLPVTGVAKANKAQITSAKPGLGGADRGLMPMVHDRPAVNAARHSEKEVGIVLQEIGGAKTNPSKPYPLNLYAIHTS